MRTLMSWIVGLALAGSLLPAPAAALTLGDRASSVGTTGAPRERCLIAPVAGPGDDLPVGLGSCPGVRPGAAVQTDVGRCTFNYVVRGVPELGPTRTFIGTAGHCVLASPGTSTWARGAGPIARNGAGEAVGRAVYAALGDTIDYALIEPFEGVSVEATMCHFGGPIGHAAASADTTVVLQHSGQGAAISAVVPGRSHVARRFDDPREVRFDGPATFGDSGAPLARDGRAVGIIVSTGADTGGIIRAFRLRPQLDRAGAVLRLQMSLVTAP